MIHVDPARSSGVFFCHALNKLLHGISTNSVRCGKSLAFGTLECTPQSLAQGFGYIASGVTACVMVARWIDCPVALSKRAATLLLKLGVPLIVPLGCVLC